MREMIASNKDLATRIEKLEDNHDRTGSIIEILVEDINRITKEIQMRVTPAYISLPKQRVPAP